MKKRIRLSTFAAAIFGVLLAFALGPCAAAGSQDGMPLRIVVESMRPPFAFRTPTGVLAGFDVAIAGALCREMRRPCLITARPLSRALKELETGAIDMVVAGLVPTPDLLKRFDFTERYYRAGSVFVAKKGTETLAGARFGVLTDSPQHTYLHSRPDMSALRSSSSQSTLWTLLSSGSIDAVLVDNLLAFAFLLSKEGKEYDSLGPALSLDTVPGTHHIAIGKGNKTLRQALDKALQALRRNGQYIALSYRYFAFDID